MEYRAVERRVGLGGQRRSRRSRKQEYRNGKQGQGLAPAESTGQLTSDSTSFDQGEAVGHQSEERPVYWKLLQRVLENLGLTEQQWTVMYVDQ